MLRLDWNLLFTVINLLLLFVLMKIFLFKPVQKIIAARQAEADKQFDEAAAKQADEICVARRCLFGAYCRFLSLIHI